MRNSIKISNLFILLLFILSCSNDDSTEGVSIENQPPTAFTINIAIDKNTAQLNWTNAEDPENDTIEYTVLLENTPIISQNTTSFIIDDLLYDREYQGSIIANDGNGNEIEVPFTFKTDYMKLLFFESDNGSDNNFLYEYDSNNVLVQSVQSFQSVTNTMVYDDKGRLSSIGNTTYTYNFNGLLTKVSDGTGKGDLKFLYDDQDRIRELNILRTGDNNYVGVSKMNYTYDTSGNLTVLHFERRHTSDNTDGVQLTFYRWLLSYDNVGNLVERTFQTSDNEGITYETSRRQVYAYDNKKNPWTPIIKEQFQFNIPTLFSVPREYRSFRVGTFNIDGYGIQFVRGNHNIINLQDYRNGDLNIEFNIAYEYNESGYPISAKYSVNDISLFPKWVYQE
ncbi:hypothetical protein GCM10009430_39210 [Aquimarina litoralis]|uniref:Fibronectin type-III domain-containing protein n=1 Tax=Aquimarina litoralis TaxID=584605 RepID=A0ABP3UE51_9FLAO